MPAAGSVAAFALVCLTMVLTPGPNMIYLVSRAICQGRAAGLVSLAGVALGFLVYIVSAALGLTALVFAVPVAYDALRLAGAAYLLFLAWQAVRPGGTSPFEVRVLPADSPRRLFAMGFLTNLLNPKAALLYLSLLPQFVAPDAGSVFSQSIVLGLMQMAISLTVNGLIICAAGGIAGFLRTRPLWARVQRLVMGAVLGGLALRMAADSRP